MYGQRSIYQKQKIAGSLINYFFSLFGIVWIAYFITYIMGIFHAFSQSVVLGIISIFLSPLIEFIDWFSSKDLWREIAQLLGL